MQLRYDARADAVSYTRSRKITCSVRSLNEDTSPKVPSCPYSALKPLPKSKVPFLLDLRLANNNRQLLAEKYFEDGSTVASGRLLGLLPAVWTGGPSPTQEVLAAEQAGKVGTGMTAAGAKVFGEESVLLVDDVDRHRRLRKLLGPALSSEAVDSYLPDIQRIVEENLETWAETCVKEGTLLAVPALKVLTSEVISCVAMDLRFSRQEVVQFQKDAQHLFAQVLNFIPIDVWPLPFWKAMRTREKIANLLQERVNAARQAAAEQRLPGSTTQEGRDAASRLGPVSTNSKQLTLHKLVSAVDETGHKLTDKQIIDNLITFMYAGTDTSTTLLSYLLLLLVQHPQVFHRMQQEQATLVSRYGHAITPEVMRGMLYSQAVINETHRHNTAVEGMLRKVKEDIVVGGYDIPAGTLINISIQYMHRNDPRWPAASQVAPQSAAATAQPGTTGGVYRNDADPLHPSHFNPDRFLCMTEEQRQQQGTQMPYGGGIRSCLGAALANAEVKIFLAVLARSYTFTADINTTWVLTPMPTPRNKLPIRILRM